MKTGGDNAAATVTFAGVPAAGPMPALTPVAAPSGSLGGAYRGAFTVSLASKVAGFVRELVIAHTFGATPVANLYFTANQVPTYVQSFFFGAFALPTVPMLREMHRRGAAREFERRLLRGMVAVVAVAALVGWVLAAGLIDAPAVRQGPGLWLFLAPLFLCCLAIPRAGIGYCGLLAGGDTTRASAVPAVMNMSAVLLLALGCLVFGASPLVLTVSTAAGIAVQALLASRYQPFATDTGVARDDVSISRRYRRGLWMAVAENTCFAGAFFWQTQLYGLSAAGGTALFFYAYRIANFPFLLFVAPAQQLAYRRAAAGSETKQRALVYGAIVAVGLGAAGALAVLGPWLIRWVYQRGAMTAEACAGVAALAAPLCLSLLAVSLVQTAGRYLSQQGRHATYVAVAVPMYVLANFSRLAAADHFGLAGMALAGAAVEFVAAGLLVTRSLQRLH